MGGSIIKFVREIPIMRRMIIKAGNRYFIYLPTRPVSPHLASTALLISSAVYASGLRPHVRGRHSSVPTGQGLRPQPSQPSARARGQNTNKARV